MRFRASKTNLSNPTQRPLPTPAPRPTDRQTERHTHTHTHTHTHRNCHTNCSKVVTLLQFFFFMCQLFHMQRAPVAYWRGELTLNPLGFSPLWFEPRLGHMWESQLLLTDGQVVFPWFLRFSPTFDERSAQYK